jgi:hypothetical protein
VSLQPPECNLVEIKVSVIPARSKICVAIFLVLKEVASKLFDMTVRYGKPVEQWEEVTLDHLLRNPVWVTRYELPKDSRTFGWTFPVLDKRPKIAREMFHESNFVWLLCTVKRREMHAKADYRWKAQHITNIEFWIDGQWVPVDEADVRRPLTLVAVPKINGQAGMEFQLLTKKDYAAPVAGGDIVREDLNDGFVLGKDLKTVVRKPLDKYVGKFLASLKTTAMKRKRNPAVKFGRPKHMEKITLEDCLNNPIWVSAHDERHDEEWLKPVASPSEVTPKVLAHAPILTFQVKGKEMYGTGYYDHEDGMLFGISLWINGKWEELETKVLRPPARFVPLPSILGLEKMSFLWTDPKRDCAVREERT